MSLYKNFYCINTKSNMLKLRVKIFYLFYFHNRYLDSKLLPNDHELIKLRVIINLEKIKLV